MDRASLTATLTGEALIDLTSQLVAIPTVNFGAGDFRVCRQPDEFVPIPDLVNVARIPLDTALRFITLEGDQEEQAAR
ncbi:hypothetical protein JQU41_09140 [Ponticoccus sp. SC6-36]|nr:hypothetical protein [Ponticoccus sp. SC6-36]